MKLCLFLLLNWLDTLLIKLVKNIQGSISDIEYLSSWKMLDVLIFKTSWFLFFFLLQLLSFLSIIKSLSLKKTDFATAPIKSIGSVFYFYTHLLKYTFEQILILEYSLLGFFKVQLRSQPLDVALAHVSLSISLMGFTPQTHDLE